MGSYATTTSLSRLIPNALAGGTSTTDTEAVATFSAHVDRAEADINSVLAERYSLPFTAIPPSVRSWAEDLACYYFLRAAVSQDGRVADSSADRFKPAYDRLTAAQTNGFREVLADTAGSVVSRRTAGMYQSSTKDYSPVFELDEPTNWEPDNDRIDAVESDRL